MRQIKNFLLTLAISRGVPMLLGGDEFRRSQRGNNNAYCQDNETSWVDWSLRQRHDEIVRFTAERARPSPGPPGPASGSLLQRRGHPVVRSQGRSPDWFDGRQKRVACLIRGQDGPDLYLMFNADTEPISFALPRPPRPGEWRLAVDTAQPSPRDASAVGEEGTLPNGTSYEMAARSGAVLVARRRP